MTRRYFAPELCSGERVQALLPEEASHAARVMRAKQGEKIVLFDGQGYEASATIRSISKRDCSVEIDHVRNVDREPSCSAHFFVALPKQDRSKEMIERLTELGVASVAPIICERTQRGPSSGLLEKLRRVVIEACKQSNRNRLLEIAEPVDFAEAVRESATRDDTSPCRLLTHPGGVPFRTAVASAPDRAEVWIGPEGGFTDEEAMVAQESGCCGVDLGKRIYRIETAACVMASMLVH